MSTVYEREYGRVKAFIDGVCVWAEKTVDHVRKGWRGRALSYWKEELGRRIDASLQSGPPHNDGIPHFGWLSRIAREQGLVADEQVFCSLVEQLRHLRDSVAGVPPHPVFVEPDDPQEGPERRADFLDEEAAWLPAFRKSESAIKNQVRVLRSLTDGM